MGFEGSINMNGHPSVGCAAPMIAIEDMAMATAMGCAYGNKLQLQQRWLWTANDGEGSEGEVDDYDEVYGDGSSD